MKSKSRSRSVGEPSPAATTTERVSQRRRWLLIVGCLIIVAGLVPAWRRASFAWNLSRARSAMAESDFDAALSALQSARSLRPSSAEVEYRLAVVRRRSGQLKRVEQHLQAAADLGWSEADVHRQRLLLAAQVGRFHDVEQELAALFKQPNTDEAALEIYEALATGYYANHQIKDAIQCLDFWIKWRPQDVDPRMMRADVFNAFNDPVAAVEDYEAVIQHQPDYFQARTALGTLRLQQSQIEEAKAQFHYCYQHGHRDAEVFLGLAECEFRNSDSAAARQWLDQLKFAELEPEKRAKAFKLAADIARFDRDHGRAIELLTEALEDWPHDAGVHQSLGQSYAADGQQELAKRHLDRSQEITRRAERYYNLQRQVISDPNNASLRFDVGLVLVEQGMPDEAQSWWESAIRVDRMHLASHVALAEYYRTHGREDLTEKHLQVAQLAAEAAFRRGWVAVQENDLPQATAAYEQLADVPGFEAQTRLLNGGLQVKQEQLDEAIESLQPLLTTSLGPMAMIVIAEARLKQGQPLVAEGLLKTALQANPAAVDAHRWLSVIYYDFGAVNQAQVHLLQTAELAPNDYRPHRLLGLMNRDYEIHDEAVRCYQETLRRHPQQPSREEVLLEMAECQIKLRDFEAALETLKQARPSVERATMEAECYYNTRRVEVAVKMLDTILEQAPDTVLAIVLRADAHLVAEEAEAASLLLSRAVTLSPYDHDTHRKLAQALTRLGREDEARAQLQEADRLKEIRQQFAKLHEQAFDSPYDAALRRELARVALEMGRPDLAEVWNKAAEALEK